MNDAQDERRNLEARMEGLHVLADSMQMMASYDGFSTMLREAAVHRAREIAARIANCLCQAEIPDETVATIDREVAALRQQLFAIPAQVAERKEGAREVAAEFSVGEAVWHFQWPGIVISVSSDQIGQVRVQYFNGAVGQLHFASGRDTGRLRKLDFTDETQRQAWVEARDQDVIAKTWVDDLVGTEQHVRAWVTGSAGDAASMRVLEQHLAEIRRSLGRNTAEPLQLLQDAAVVYINQKSRLNGLLKILHVHVVGNSRAETDFADKRRRAYAKLLREATSTVVSSLLNTKDVD